MTDLWTLSGQYFGYLDGEDLWRSDGRHVGKCLRDDVFGPDGRYLCQVAFSNRLRVAKEDRLLRIDPFPRKADRAARTPLPNRMPYTSIGGYEDLSPDFGTDAS